MENTKQYRLPKEFATKWLAALRSGEYKQGYSYLYIKSFNCYCVLGVAGSVAGNDDSNMEGGVTLGRGWIHDIPEEINSINHLSLGGVVAKMNDSKIPFPEIADWIESNCELY